MLIDTNIFIDFLKGSSSAKRFFTEKKNLTTSVLVIMEIIAGLPKKNDVKKLATFLESSQIKVYQINEAVSIKAYQIFTDYRWITGISIADSLIAATALVDRKTLVTLNTKHFAKIKELDLIKPY